MNTEDAYTTMAEYLNCKVNLPDWDKLVLEADVADTMVKSLCYGLKNNQRFNDVNNLH